MLPLAPMKRHDTGLCMPSNYESLCRNAPIRCQPEPSRSHVRSVKGNLSRGMFMALQVGPDDLARNALLQLLVQATKRDAFHTLRTVEQLGYMVRPIEPDLAPVFHANARGW